VRWCFCVPANIQGAETTTDAITADIAGFVSTIDEHADEISSADLTRWFLNLFPNRFTSVIRREGCSKWMEISRFHHLTDAEILEVLQTKAKLQRGYRFDPNTKFLVLQIPAASPYHNPQSISELRKSLEAISVKPRHYQFNDDWYLHIYLTSGGRSTQLSRGLKRWCQSEHFIVSDETLLVHPSDDPLPYPLQSGFTWLNDRCQLLVRRDELSFEDALAFFLQDAGKNAVDTGDLLDAFNRIEPLSENEDAVADQEIAAAGTIDCTPPDSAGNVIDLQKSRLGDDLISACAAGTDDTGEAAPEQEPESQLLLFPQPGRSSETGLSAKPACETGAPPEQSQTRKRKSERRLRREGEAGTRLRSAEPPLPTSLPEE
jgi:hypothetical protein